MIDVFGITRAAKLRRLRSAAPPTQARCAPKSSIPEPPFRAAQPDRQKNAPSALAAVMRRHDRVNERHIAGG